MYPVGFELTIAAVTYALDRAATGTGNIQELAMVNINKPCTSLGLPEM
jgi:hypothetical protein